MIENSLLVYGAQEPFLSVFEFPHPLVNTLFLAVITTLLSYQATELLIHIFLSFKPSSTAPISYFFTFLLIRHTPALAILSSLTRSARLNRQRFNLPNLPSNQQCPSRQKSSLPISASLRLLFLLTVAPLVNVIAVLLTLERTQELTIADSKFGGLEFGIQLNGSRVKLEPQTEGCVLAPLKLSRGEEALIHFTLCIATTKVDHATEAFFRFAMVSDLFLQIDVGVGLYAVSKKSLGVLHVNSTTSYYVRLQREGVESEKLTAYALKLLAWECRREDVDGAYDDTRQYEYAPHFRVVKKLVLPGCKARDENSASRVATELEKLITFIATAKLEITGAPRGDKPRIPEKTPVFLSGDTLPFLKRRRRTVSLLWLLIVTAVVCVIRLLTSFLCKNDVDLGVEALLKFFLGLGCCDSMLWLAGTTVAYNQEGDPGKIIRIDRIGGQEKLREVERSSCGIATRG